MNFYISSLMKESMWDLQCSVPARSWLSALIRERSSSTALLCVLLWHQGHPAARWPVTADTCSTLGFWEGLVFHRLTFACVWSEMITACRNTARGRSRGLLQLRLFWTRDGRTVNQCRWRSSARATGCWGGARGWSFALFLTHASRLQLRSKCCTHRQENKYYQKVHPNKNATKDTSERYLKKKKSWKTRSFA